jgi:uncharacterized protein YdeI (YjbR/CyaY-like superfamily)
MPTTDPRVDAYIENAAPFARPILVEIRARMHAACPDLTETLKWSMPAFDFHGPLAGMAAFKAHCMFAFWKHELVLGEAPRADQAMGSYGRITKLGDLPGKRAFAALVKKAAQLNVDGVKVPKQAAKRPALPVPDALAAALRKNAAARRAFEGMSPSHRREYCEWIAEAKREETRDRRVAQAVEWLKEGKSRNWKYQR